MKTSKLLIVLTVLAAVILIGAAEAEVSLKNAIKIGKKNFNDLVNQSYHYKIEYDDVIALILLLFDRYCIL